MKISRRGFIVAAAIAPTLIGGFISMDLFWGFHNALGCSSWLALTAWGGVLGGLIYEMPDTPWKPVDNE